MKDVVIVSAVRTAIGSFGGTLKDTPPVELGAIVLQAALDRGGIRAENVDEVIMGCVLQAGYGQGVARQAALKAGLRQETPATTINMICGSGLKSVSLGVQSIQAGDNDVVLAGGTENMSMTPYLLKNARWGMKMGDGQVYDPMVKDGLWEAFNDYHMGMTAENLVDQFQLTRAEQDAFSVQSQNRAEEAQRLGKFEGEIVPVMIPSRKGEPTPFKADEYIKAGATLESVQKLKPAFKKEGTVTAATSSGINDGAAALLIMSAEKASELGLKPLARIVSHASAGVDPKIMGIGPVPATQKALAKAGLTVADLDVVEANEAFAAQALCVMKELGLDPAKTNVNGGAIALGHPIGASGARILVSLVHELIRSNGRYGLATLCIGGGMGEAMIIEKL